MNEKRFYVLFSTLLGYIGIATRRDEMKGVVLVLSHISLAGCEPTLPSGLRFRDPFKGLTNKFFIIIIYDGFI